ncbi:hypothetical protein Fmac_011678 [Flemingia macrophylla]|uniref:Two-component response regulator n=1 Tax=Flemingia macrophylla TaxID=520843 RepID=A0ABD1MNZ5_9FABA
MAEFISLASQLSVGLKVLAIDHDPTVLDFIVQTCDQFKYQVVTCTESPQALNLLREGKVCIHVILMELHMSNMDGLEFLQHIKNKIPVIVMSADDATSSVMKAVAAGACDYWIKPLHEKQLKNMWTHAFRKVFRENKNFGRWEGHENKKRENNNSEFGFSTLIDATRGVSPTQPVEVDESQHSYQPPAKKPRLVWTTTLHQEFLKAVKQIGDENAVPKKVLEVMNIPGLTREHVASHLQKYRNTMKNSSNGVTQQQNQMALANTIQGTTESMLGVPERVEFQSLAVPCMVSYSTLKTLDSALPSNMISREECSTPAIQLPNHLHSEQIVKHAHPFNIVSINNFSQPIMDSSANMSMNALQQQCQQTMMHHQISPMYLQSSNMMVSGNPSFVTEY